MTSPADRVESSPPLRWTWQWGMLLVLIVLVVELVARVEERITFGVPLDSRVASPNDLVWMHADGARGRPGARYQKWGLNNLGFRGPDMEPVPPPGVTRVVVVGASETFGLYESPGKEYPRLLEDSLRGRARRSCAHHGAGIEVANAALPGMATPSMERLLDGAVRDARPDLVVLYPSPGFYLNARAPKPTMGAAGTDSTLPWRNALRFRALERARRQLKALVPDPVLDVARRAIISRRNRAAEPVLFPDVPADRLAQFESDLRSVVGMARSLGVPVILVGHANATMAPGFDDPGLVGAWVYQFPAATGSALMGFHARALALERGIATDSGVAFVDLPAALQGRWRDAFADFVHFTDAGSAVVAAVLAEAAWPLIDCGP